ncbi:hypothetical protein RBWH47_02590 [Rhodopirellula baltica WH47]|uniref:Uncharacterized protein n=1 Tax=Rhodopirellula baltica WH47 TaxID=991778 RepID=F2AMV8_RHOBT|nr:hypothetical protein RBWH47_02590 [Rhodopirellula baltica WH47]
MRERESKMRCIDRRGSLGRLVEAGLQSLLNARSNQQRTLPCHALIHRNTIKSVANQLIPIVIA